MSANYSLDGSHPLIYCYRNNTKNLHRDLVIYSKFSHDITSLSHDIKLFNEIQILSNLYNVVININRNEDHETITPYNAKKTDFFDVIYIKIVGEKYFALHL